MDFIDSYDIELEKEIYRSGELIKGCVIIDVNEAVRVASIQVHLRGKVHIEWKITRAGERRNVKDDEALVDQMVSVWGSSDEDSLNLLKKGHHRLDFEFRLPDRVLPPSFESRVGTVRYCLRVLIDIPYCSPPQGLKYFTVVGPNIDCLDEKFTTPRYGNKQIVTKCLCCSAGNVSLDVCLEKSAYCCGESLRLRCDVQNGGDREVSVSLQMYQVVTYKISKGETVLSKEVIHQVVGHNSYAVRPHSTKCVGDFGDDLKLPTMPPTMQDVSKLIHINYSLKIGLLMEKCIDNNILEFPIFISICPVTTLSDQHSNLIFEPANDHVEGGIYMSPEFQLGQVYDGNSDSVEDVILYRPLYARIVDPHAISPPIDKSQEIKLPLIRSDKDARRSK